LFCRRRRRRRRPRCRRRRRYCFVVLIRKMELETKRISSNKDKLNRRHHNSRIV